MEALVDAMFSAALFVGLPAAIIALLWWLFSPEPWDLD